MSRSHCSDTCHLREDSASVNLKHVILCLKCDAIFRPVNWQDLKWIIHTRWHMLGYNTSNALLSSTSRTSHGELYRRHIAAAALAGFGDTLQCFRSRHTYCRYTTYGGTRVHVGVHQTSPHQAETDRRHSAAVAAALRWQMTTMQRRASVVLHLARNRTSMTSFVATCWPTTSRMNISASAVTSSRTAGNRNCSLGFLSVCRCQCAAADDLNNPWRRPRQTDRRNRTMKEARQHRYSGVGLRTAACHSPIEWSLRSSQRHANRVTMTMTTTWPSKRILCRWTAWRRRFRRRPAAKRLLEDIESCRLRISLMVPELYRWWRHCSLPRESSMKPSRTVSIRGVAVAARRTRQQPRKWKWQETRRRWPRHWRRMTLMLTLKTNWQKFLI